MLLVAFAFLAGVVTILSPCILPILPIVLSTSIGGTPTDRSRPFGVMTGFVLSFTFFTLFLSIIVQSTGIPADTLRHASVFIIALFGLSLIIPQFQLLSEQLFSKLSGIAPTNQNHSGFGGGLLIGFSLGLLWTPCVGPILASVISLALTGTVTFDAFVITLAYSLGTAIPMFLIIRGGQNVLRSAPWLLSDLARIQKIFGLIMILTAIGIYYNVDRKFQTFILNAFPNYGVGLTKVEDNELVRKQLESSNDNERKNINMGKPLFDQVAPKGIKAPELIPGGNWFNTKPLKLSELQGKVMLVDFWTYSCINCQRTLPYLRDWHKKYEGNGLVIIGVHSPEFEFEKNPKNVEGAIADFNLTYPIVQDNNFATWRAYDNHYWPAKYLIDKDGFIRYHHFGEGKYDETEAVIQELLKDAGATDVTAEPNNPSYQVYSKTPELYLGYGRLESLSSPERVKRDQLSSYSNPLYLGANEFAYSGDWIITKEYANPQKGSSLTLNFEGKEVFLVMRSKGESAEVKVYLDDQLTNFGDDNHGGTVTVKKDTLYKLIRLPSAGRHNLRLEFGDSNAELFAFTFG